jgi:hypothetical protein
VAADRNRWIALPDAEAFVLAEGADGTTTGNSAKKRLRPVVNGAAGYVAKFIDATNIDNSILYESAGQIGLSTTAPQGPLHINSVMTYRGGGVGSIQTGNNPGIMLENPSTNSAVLLSESFGFTVFASLSGRLPASARPARRFSSSARSPSSTATTRWASASTA